jgi:methylated-DNA-protein-cysteine methyltransferase-like protein
VSEDGPYARIYAWARLIPPGRLVTYGQLAALAGLPGAARMVGYAMRAARDDDDIPWQRVINAAGQISPRADPFGESLQRQLLEAEGIAFDAQGRADLKRLRWLPEELLSAQLEEMPRAPKKVATKKKPKPDKEAG